MELSKQPNIITTTDALKSLCENLSNEPAIGLYRALGFEESGKRKGYYQDGEDAVLMKRDVGRGWAEELLYTSKIDWLD